MPLLHGVDYLRNCGSTLSRKSATPFEKPVNCSQLSYPPRADLLAGLQQRLTAPRASYAGPEVLTRQPSVASVDVQNPGTEPALRAQHSVVCGRLPCVCTSDRHLQFQTAQGYQ